MLVAGGWKMMMRAEWGDHGERKTEWKVGWVVQAIDRRIDAVMRKREMGGWRTVY